MNFLLNNPAWFQKLSPSAKQTCSIALSIAAGFAIAIVMHYVLYRVGLPSKPFIYVAF
jgi:hypothetical protein